MAEAPPVHLTPFGVWLWVHLPRWERVSSRRGQGFVGLKSKSGILWAGLVADYYYFFWPAPICKPTHWRFSLWLLGRPCLRWRRATRLRLAYGTYR